MKQVVAFAAGGTAGHVEPAIAVARELNSQLSDMECLFIGTKSGIENRLVPAAGFNLSHITKLTFPRKISFEIIAWPFRWIGVLVQAFRILRRTNLLIGFGGYVSAPCYVAAKLLRIPFIVQEQNAKPGWANRLGAQLTANIAVTFASARNAGKRWSSARVVGLPLRESIIQVAESAVLQRNQLRTQASNNLGFNPERPVMLIFGGSLGAERINQSVAEALTELLAKGIQVIHAVGQSNKLPAAQPGYLPVPYLENMAEAYAASDLILARSGAATCCEIAAIQNYSVLVPLAIGNGEQRANAAELVSTGVAEILDNSHLTGEWIMENIDRLMLKATQLRENRTMTVSENSAKAMAAFASTLLVKSSS